MSLNRPGARVTVSDAKLSRFIEARRCRACAAPSAQYHLPRHVAAALADANDAPLRRDTAQAELSPADSNFTDVRNQPLLRVYLCYWFLGFCLNLNYR